MKNWDESNLVKNLPDIYDKTPIKQNADGTYRGSNNAKILETEKHASDGLKYDIRDLFESLDIERATGVTLDLYGDLVGQPRGVAKDVQYRLMIKSKIMQNLSTGDYPSVLKAICMTFNCDPSEVLIVASEKSCCVNVESLPFNAINSAGLSAGQAVAMIERLLPIGVKVDEYDFEGTFELASSYEDMTVDGDTKGLTDTYENMNNPNAIGGVLGFTTGDIDVTELPI